VTSPADRETLRDRLYEEYATQHSGSRFGSAVRLLYDRDIHPALPPMSAGSVLDIGCGQGELVRLLLADGYDAAGVDVSPEQVAIANAAGLDQVLLGDYYDLLTARSGHLTAVIATDLLEHLTKPEVIRTFDAVLAALVPGGVFIARVPNAVSPFGGNIRYGDFTHESWFTARSVRQLARAAGFDTLEVRSCPPLVHGPMSALRAGIWSFISLVYHAALTVETGQIRGHIVTQNLTFVAAKGR
jgi:2-polyprenyl-3-methyl-5-hydroxy-6-metoxy-1,4-benzoquinol methylase